MQNIKDNIRQKLIEAGRILVKEKGVDFLTARKLSEASECSIGTIYNQFGNMDEFIAEQNCLTLKELEKKLNNSDYTSDSYCNINRMVKIFTDFVVENKELWLLLYNFHLSKHEGALDRKYKKQLVKMLNYSARDFKNLFPILKNKHRKIMREVLAFGIFGISAMAAADMFEGLKTVNRENVCRIFADTFLAGVTLLDKEQ